MVDITSRQNQRHSQSIEGTHFTLTDSELPVDIPIPRWAWWRSAWGVDELLHLEFLIKDTTECGHRTCLHISSHVWPLRMRHTESEQIISSNRFAVEKHWKCIVFDCVLYFVLSIAQICYVYVVALQVTQSVRIQTAKARLQPRIAHAKGW